MLLTDNAITPNEEKDVISHSKEIFHTAEEFKEVGDQYFKKRDLIQADIYYHKSLEIDPNQYDVYKNLGVSQYYQGKPEEAIKLYDKALALKPEYPEALSNRGLALHDLEKFEEALIFLNHAIELKPDFAFAYNNRGMTLKMLVKLEDSLASYDRAIALKPDYPEAYNNRGTVLRVLNRFHEELASYDHAIVLKPDYAQAFFNRGDVLCILKQFDAALVSYDRAIALKADFLDAHLNRGILLRSQNRLDEALASFDRAILLRADYAEAHKNRGATLKDLNRKSEALESFQRAIELEPDIALGYGFCLEIRAMTCEWGEYEDYLEQFRLKINEGKYISHPLIALWLSNSPMLHKRIAENCIKSLFPPNSTLPLIPKYPKHNKIRIGYFSGEFFNHAVSFLTAELFERHDKSRFELIAFSFSTRKDEMTERLKNAFDQFFDVSGSPDSEVTSKVRELKIDIAIDLGGFTGGSRTAIFAMRAAPIQVNYLGYPGTMGADYIDYLIADTTIIPASHQQYYSEKVVYLPSFQVNDSKRVISDRQFSREELGLPFKNFVFCSFNNITKITPFIFDSWMHILKQVNGSVLWLLDDNPTAVNNLKKEAISRGIDSSRLIFAQRLSVPEYLARYRLADLFLDTLPYNAGTTASDALWAGLPVLTLMGETFAGRMAASLLNAIQLPELITTTQEEYEACAIDLATHPEKLKSIKQKLANNRLTTPLFDIEYFTKNIESAYIQMYERYQVDLKPDHIYVTDNKN